MSNQTEIFPDFVPIRQAARQVCRDRSYVRRLVDEGQVTAIVAGGRPKQPRLRVNMKELVDVIRRTSIYVPPGRADESNQQSSTRVPTSKLHPDAARMRKRHAK